MKEPARPTMRDGPYFYFDNQLRRHCVLDLDAAHEAKTDEALAAWVRKWGENIRNAIWTA